MHNESEVIAISDAALSKLRQKVYKGERRTLKLIGVFILFFIIGVGVFIYLRKRKLLIYKSEGLNPTILSPGKNGTSNPTNNGTNSMDAISDETESRILELLKELEKTTFFIKSDITLARLAYQLDTNTRYLSYVINTHRGKTFPVYINDLRINYIVDKLKTEPIFLKYKISHLAELSGFSSHSKFSSEFRRVVGESPSKYILDIQTV